MDDKSRAQAALAKVGAKTLDCPISGTGSQAIAKDLVIYASGDSAAIARVRDCYAAFTRAVHDVGAFGGSERGLVRRHRRRVDGGEFLERGAREREQPLFVVGQLHGKRVLIQDAAVDRRAVIQDGAEQPVFRHDHGAGIGQRLIDFTNAAFHANVAQIRTEVRARARCAVAIQAAALAFEQRLATCGVGPGGKSLLR